MKNNHYWMCIIGPVNWNDIPAGGDLILRMPVRDKFNEVFGEDKICSSGWSVDEERYQLLRILHLLSTSELKKILNQYMKSK